MRSIEQSPPASTGERGSALLDSLREFDTPDGAQAPDPIAELVRQRRAARAESATLDRIIDEEVARHAHHARGGWCIESLWDGLGPFGKVCLILAAAAVLGSLCVCLWWALRAAYRRSAKPFAGRSRIWQVSAAASSVAVLMVLFPPWLDVGPRISSGGYGFLFTGPFDEAYAYRLDTGRLFTQLVLVGLVAGTVAALTNRRDQ